MDDYLRESEVMRTLHGYNPWWGGREAAVPDFRRLAFLAVSHYLQNRELRRAILLSGPRRVGKTTILSQLGKQAIADGLEPQSILFLSLDHPVLRQLDLSEILRIYHGSICPEDRPILLLLDEVQYSRDWDLHLKQFTDHRPNYRIVATGSTSVLQSQRISESGVGRWVRVHVPTLSFYEFLHLRCQAPDSIPTGLRPTDIFGMPAGELPQLGTAFRPVMPSFRRYLLIGGFPETAKQESVELSQRLLREDVVERVIKRDMTSLFNIRNVDDLERLFLYICLNSGGILSVQTCARELGVPNSTVANYLSLLEQANLIYRVEQSGTGGKKILKARHKVYLADAALRNAVLLRGEEILDQPEEMGPVVETTVLRHLYAYYYRDNPKVVYWRDSAKGKEVDIIVKSPAYTIPVEVKYRENARVSDKDGLVIYCTQEQVRQGYWVTRREEDFDFQDFPEAPARILRIPAHVFTYLLGQAERLLWQK